MIEVREVVLQIEPKKSALWKKAVKRAYRNLSELTSFTIMPNVRIPAVVAVEVNNHIASLEQEIKELQLELAKVRGQLI